MPVWRQLPLALLTLILVHARPALTQQPPAGPERPWFYSAQQRHRDSERFSESASKKTYSILELIDLAEAHNPETRAAWELARAQAAARGVARSELFPTLTALASSQTVRRKAFFGSSFTPQAIQAIDATLSLTYTVFDFGARAGRIDAAKAQALGTNFSFNDAHRRVIFSVKQAYYNVLNAEGKEAAASASLANSEAVRQASEDRLKQGLGTSPDVLEAISAKAQLQFDLQTPLGAERVAHSDLAVALGYRQQQRFIWNPSRHFRFRNRSVRRFRRQSFVDFVSGQTFSRIWLIFRLRMQGSKRRKRSCGQALPSPPHQPLNGWLVISRTIRQDM